MITALDHIAIAVPDLEKAINVSWRTSVCLWEAPKM